MLKPIDTFILLERALPNGFNTKLLDTGRISPGMLFSGTEKYAHGLINNFYFSDISFMKWDIKVLS